MVNFQVLLYFAPTTLCHSVWILSSKYCHGVDYCKMKMFNCVKIIFYYSNAQKSTYFVRYVLALSKNISLLRQWEIN